MIPKKWLEYGVLAGLFLVPFIPIIVSESMFFPFITGKNFTFRLIVALVTALWVMLAYEHPEYRPKKTWLSLTVSLFLALILVADLFGENPWRSIWSNYERMEGFVGLIHLGAYFFVLSSVMKSRELWDRFWHVMLGVGFFESLFAFLQMGGVYAINQGATRVDATMGNAIYLAVYMMFLAFLTVYYMVRRGVDTRNVLLAYIVGSAYYIYHTFGIMVAAKTVFGLGFLPLAQLVLSLVILSAMSWLWSQRHSVVEESWFKYSTYSLLLVIQLVVLYGTATRGATLGLIGGAFLAGLLVAYQSEGKAKKIALGVAGGLVVFVLFFIAIRNTDFVAKSPVLSRFKSFDETTIVSRERIWQMSFKGWQEHPVLGWGQENFNLVFNKFYDPRLYSQEQWFDRSHNVILDWLISGGLLGLLAYLGMFAAALWSLKNTPESHMTKYEKAIFFGMLAGYFAQNITVFDNITSYIFFFSVLAFLNVTSHTDHGEETGKAGKNPEIVAGVVVIGLVIVIYFVQVKPYFESRNLIRAISDQTQNGGALRQLEYFKTALAYHSIGDSEAREQLTQFAVNAIRGTGNPAATPAREISTYAREEIMKQVAQSSTDARYYMFAGVLLNAMNLQDDSIAMLEKAVQYSPTKQTLIFELGNAYLRKGEYQKAFDILKKAYESEPSYTDAKKMYGLAALYVRQDKLAADLLKDFGPGVYDDDNFVLAFAARGEFSKVIAVWNERVKQNPTNARAYVSLGAAYIANGQQAQGIAQMKKAAQLDPSIADQINQLIEQVKSGKLK